MEAYGQVSGDAHKKKKRIAIIGVSSLILVAMVVAVAVGVTKDVGGTGSKPTEGHAPDGEVKASMKAIKAICQPTEFKETCINSLSSVAGNTTDPKELIKVSFNVTMRYLTDAAKHSHTLQELEKDKGTRDALRICRDLMDDAIDDLKRAFEHSATFDPSKLKQFVNEMKVWLGGALAYQETCFEGFEDSPGKAAEAMRKALKTAGELTRNGLSIIDQVSEMFANLNINLPSFKRRLLEHPELSKDGFPTWVTSEKRRLLGASLGNINPDVVVAKDGSGKFKTINEALKVVPKKNLRPFVIYIKEGVYAETVFFKNLPNVTMIGDGPLKTRITGRKNFKDGTKTVETATFSAGGVGFVAKDIGFENTAGPDKHQAVALRVFGDESLFYNCHMDGYQDTLYVHTHRQFYRDCTISGTIDFIFGDAFAILQNCKLVVRKPNDNQFAAVTAQGRYNQRENSALILQGCTITADPAYYPVRHKIKTFLGRPWRNYSRTIFMQTHMDDFIVPEGYMRWDPQTNNTNHLTCTYIEYQNKGPGAANLKREKWPGIKTKLTPQEALTFTPESYFEATEEWIKRTGVPYNPGMMPK